jgi:hypothetical protein
MILVHGQLLEYAFVHGASLAVNSRRNRFRRQDESSHSELIQEALR